MRHGGWIFLGLLGLASLPGQAARPALLDPGAALEALSGLGPVLERQGWTLTPARGAALSLGDIYDPVDQQVQVLGADCFDLAAARSGQGVSLELAQTLGVGGGPRAGLLGVGASASRGVDVQIERAEISEVAVANLQPSLACQEVLGRMRAEGLPVARFQIVQSILWADLSVGACLGAAVEVRATVATAQASAEDCRGLRATQTALAQRAEPLVGVLGMAGMSLDDPSSSPDPEAGKAKAPRAKKGAPPCWIAAPCAPWPVEQFVQVVGSGSDMAAADAAARERLLAPFAVRYRAVAASVGGGEAATRAAQDAYQDLLSAVRIPARHQEGYTTYALATLERTPLVASLRAEIAALEASSAMTTPTTTAAPDPVLLAHQLRLALPSVQRLAFLHASLGALEGRPSRPSQSWAAAQQAAAQARAQVQVLLPPEDLGDRLATSLTAQGLSVVRPSSASASASGGGGAGEEIAVVVQRRAVVRPVQGMQSVRATATADLVVMGRVVKTLQAEASGASADEARARAAAEADLDAQLVAGLTAAILEVL